jgi:hypothetical protein
MLRGGGVYCTDKFTGTLNALSRERINGRDWHPNLTTSLAVG